MPAGDLGNTESWLDSLDSPLRNKATLTCTSIAARAYRKCGIELVYHLAKRGRWEDAEWLTKALIARFWNPENRREHRLKPQTTSPWQSRANSLTADLQHPVRLDRPPGPPFAETVPDSSLEPVDRQDWLERHKILGQLWLAIGKLIIADPTCDGRISPGILRIIAIFHETGFMPSSVYDDGDHGAPDEHRSVPTLLSSHFYNALSEAALPASSSSYSLLSSRSLYEALGSLGTRSSFRFRPFGLSHEAWLELILWACSEGGWVQHGSFLLRLIAGVPTKQWISLKKVKDRQRCTIDASRLDQRLLARYADQNLAILTESEPELRRDHHVCLESCWSLRLLFKNVVEQPPKYSWSEKVVRLFENHDFGMDHDPYLAERLLDLALLEEQDSDLDRHATELMFRSAFAILQAHVSLANLTGALRIFGKILRRTDHNKRLSLQRFFALLNTRGQSSVEATGFEAEAADDSVMTKSGPEIMGEQPGLDQSAFYPSMSNALLARFLDLITEVRAFSFGRWLIDSESPDKPIIAEHLFDDYHLVPALVRFAANSRDSRLLNAVLSAVRKAGTDQAIPLHWLLSILESQIELRNWDGVREAFQQYTSSQHRPGTLDGYATCLFARAALIDGQDQSGPAWRMIEQLVRKGGDQYAIKTVLALMGTSCREWAVPITSLMPPASLSASWPASLSQAAFVVLLQGIVHARGSECGRGLVDLLWPASKDHGSRPSLTLPQTELATSQAWLTCNTKEDRMDLRSRGALRPNASAIRVIQAAAERESDNLGPRADTLDIEEWGDRCLARLGFSARDRKSTLTGKYPLPAEFDESREVEVHHEAASKRASLQTRRAGNSVPLRKVLLNRQA